MLKDKLKLIKSSFSLPDYLNQGFIAFLSLIIIFYHSRFDDWYLLIPLNIAISLVIIYFVNRYETMEESAKKKESFTRIFRFWYPAVMIIFLFKEVYLIMIHLKPVFYDSELIKIDFWMFGCNPTQCITAISNPYLTEFLQLIYSIFYFMPVIIGLEMYLWRRFYEYKFFTFVILLGFIFSFIGYLIVPAIGPRFTLHEFANINNELPGIFITNFLRDAVNLGESIRSGMPDPLMVAQRDAFPSGHTITILLVAFLSWKIRSKSFYFYLPYAILMIFSTVYLRYHYVIDLIAAVVIALITILISNKLYKDRIISDKYGFRITE